MPTAKGAETVFGLAELMGEAAARAERPASKMVVACILVLWNIDMLRSKFDAVAIVDIVVSRRLLETGWWIEKSLSWESRNIIYQVS